MSRQLIRVIVIKTVIYEFLRRFYEEHPEAMRAVDEAVREMNADYDELDGC